jgi:hypothetical protein
MTTDAKDLGFIVGLLHAIAASHEGDVMLVGNVRAEQIVEICKHIATLTRERDALLLRCKEAEAGWLLAATQRDDFAVSLVMARDGGK